MTNKITEIANRFLDEKECSVQELSEFKNWLSSPATQSEVENWLSEHWTNTSEIDSNTLIETVFQQIQEYEKDRQERPAFSISNILKLYQRIAAFLLIPILGFGIWFGVGQFGSRSVHFTETIAPRGQKSQIVLADGTKVWLNSDTKIKYPGLFSKNQRDVYLDGEAFFEVAKNPDQPFVVHTSGINVKVLGTKFNVRAYADEDLIETSLFEGKVSLQLNEPENALGKETDVVPGQSFVYSKNDQQLTLSRFPKDEINGWKKNQLIFKDDTFSNLVRKVERWYNVKIVYDEKLFNDRRLTVELIEGERLERLMEIISLTLSVDFDYEMGKISLTPKTNDMQKR